MFAVSVSVLLLQHDQPDIFGISPTTEKKLHKALLGIYIYTHLHKRSIKTLFIVY